MQQHPADRLNDAIRKFEGALVDRGLRDVASVPLFEGVVLCFAKTADQTWHLTIAEGLGPLFGNVPPRCL